MLPLLLMLAQAQAATAPEIPTASVQAIGETQAVVSLEDAADDPAIWRNPRNPAASLIVATDKKAGLNVYDLNGRLRSSLAAGRVNNVDLRTVRDGTRQRILVAASDRNDKANGHLALYELDPAAATLAPLARVPAGAGEAYGLCLYQPKRGPLQAFVVMKQGTIAQLAIAADGRSATPLRTLHLKTQSEGCVADDRTGALYVGEEDVGIWRFAADASGDPAPQLVAPIDDRRLFADVEGLAIAAKGRRGGWLVASSQGDSAYALWRLPDLAFAGRFRVTAGKLGATSETDGIEVSTANFGPAYRGGLMIVQDGDNAPQAQNFKLLRFADVLKAIRRR